MNQSLKKLLIVGASGFGREVAWLVNRINQIQPTWELVGFLDDAPEIQNQLINGCPVVGTCDDVSDFRDAYFVCAIGSSKIRKYVIEKMISILPDIHFATLIDPSVLQSQYVAIGEGTVICANTVATVNVEIGRQVIVNLACTIGHDAVLEDFVTLYPTVNVSGQVRLRAGSEVGTGTQIIQGKTIGSGTIVGAGAVVVSDIPSNCTAVGVPAKPIKFH